MSGLTLDAGALIAFDRNDRAMVAIVARALATKTTLAIPAGALAQAWRDGRTQARLSRLLAAPVVEIVPLTSRVAREAGQLCGVTSTSDVVDSSVVRCALERGHGVVTSDPDVLARLSPRLRLVVV